MAKYECKVCGYIYNEQHAGRSFKELTECPICNEGKENFYSLDGEDATVEEVAEEHFFEEKADDVADAFNEEVENETIDPIVEEKDETPEFVVERRQEFWSPAGNKEETIVADPKEDDSPYESRIESFYSSAEPVGMAHVISEEEEKEFTPLWNSGGGTVQRVIDPFGDRSEPVVKAENVGMVMPAEAPTVEEILGEEPETVEEAVEEVTEEVFFTEESEAVEEEIVEESIEEVAETAVEEVEEILEDATVEPHEEELIDAEEIADEISESIKEASVASVASDYFFDDENDEDFFSEVVMDQYVEEQPIAEVAAEEVAEESVETIAEEAVEAVEEEIVEEAVEAVEEEIVEEATEAVVEAMVEEAAEALSEEAVEEIAEMAEEPVEEIAEMIEEPVQKEEPVIKAWSFLDDVVEAGGVVGAGMAGAAAVSQVAEEADEVEETVETTEEIAEETIAEEDILEKDKVDSLEYFNEEIRRARQVGYYGLNNEDSYDDEEEEEPKEEEVPVEDKEAEEEKTYCNNLENILILPAQLNPMPLPEGTKVEGRTVLGIGSERPLVLDNPVFSTGDYKMVQYIPNSGLTSEDYQQADAIEIIVGKGNGIEKNINSKEDLRQVVNFLRLESDGCPIGIKLGAGRIERDLEFCIFAKPDYVVLNNFSVVPLPYALHRATKYLNTVQSNIDIVIALDGVKDAEELAKIMAMGADVIALRNKPSNLDNMVMELKNHARVAGHYDVQDLNVKDLCTIDREIAEYTDIYHV